MPRGDHTGPLGGGPRTGRAAGYCGGFGTAGYLNRLGGWMGRGRGGGRGHRHWFHATGLPGWARGGFWSQGAPDPEWERRALESQAAVLQAELDAVRRRLADLAPPEQGA